MSKLKTICGLSVNHLVLFCQKSGNGKASLLRSQPFMFLKEPVRYQNTHTSPLRQANPKNPFGIGSMLLFLIPVTTFGLGTWQVKRLKWKEDLIEKLKTKSSAPPIEFPSDLSELENLEYRKVIVRGRFDHSNELFYGPKTCIVQGQESSSELISKTGQGKFGYLLITPFILSDSGQRILVNRGWIKTKDVKPEKRPETLVQGEQTIVGVVRHSEQPGKFLPSNKIEYRIWYCRNIEEMAKEMNTLPVFLDATEQSSIPGVLSAGQTRIYLRNEHLSYIITWYSLSLATAWMWYKLFFRR